MGVRSRTVGDGGNLVADRVISKPEELNAKMADGCAIASIRRSSWRLSASRSGAFSWANSASATAASGSG